MTKEEMIKLLDEIKERLVKESNEVVEENNIFYVFEEEDLNSYKKSTYKIAGMSMLLGAVDALFIRTYILCGFFASLAGMSLANVRNMKLVYKENKKLYEEVQEQMKKVPYKREEIAKLREEKSKLEELSDDDFSKLFTYRLGDNKND